MRLPRVALVILLTLVLIAASVSCGKSKVPSEQDITPPSITSVLASNITQTSATITWTTDENATSQVEYGTTTGYGKGVALVGNAVKSHSVSLPGLTPNTTYHFRVKSKDNRNNEAMSADQTFTTAQSTQSTLSVHFIDVGQGDAILIDFGNTEVLIDGGSSTPGVVGYLSNYIEGIPCTIMIKVKKRLLKK